MSQATTEEEDEDLTIDDLVEMIEAIEEQGNYLEDRLTGLDRGFTMSVRGMLAILSDFALAIDPKSSEEGRMAALERTKKVLELLKAQMDRAG